MLFLDHMGFETLNLEPTLGLAKTLGKSARRETIGAEGRMVRCCPRSEEYWHVEAITNALITASVKHCMPHDR